MKILVVDDDVDTREFIAFLLEQYGANVTAVASANETLAALTQFLPNILLSDIGMPEVDGWMYVYARVENTATRAGRANFGRSHLLPMLEKLTPSRY
ncbi:response regulator [Nostoc sp.]|uniref:response regulator n=1 Tax=Nostoc sp. TaxID=1180 RepID=UPI003FA52574